MNRKKRADEPSSLLSSKWARKSLSILLLVISSSAVHAKPYKCVWRSEHNEDLAIVFDEITTAGSSHSGHIFYKQKRIMPITVGVSMGFGNAYWNSNRSTGDVLYFYGNNLSNSLKRESQKLTPARRLLVGLNRHVYYSSQERVDDYDLIRSAGNFWIGGEECLR